MSIRTKIDFSGITSDNIVTSDNKKYIHEDDEIFNSLKDEIAACENAQVQTELATLQILEIKEQTKVISNDAIDTATDRAETAAENAENAQALAETAAINALEAERNVTEFSETLAKLDEDNTFTGNNNFTGTLTINDEEVLTSAYFDDFVKLDEDNTFTGTNNFTGTLQSKGNTVLTTSDANSFAKLSSNNTFSGTNNFTGSLTKNGNAVLTTSDANNYFKLNTSNTIDGNVQIKDSRTFSNFGYGWDSKSGAILALCSKDYTDAGCFKLFAQDGTNRVSLIGNPNGELKWGNITIDSNHIVLSDAITYFSLGFNESNDNNPRLSFYSKNNSSEANRGAFVLSANDGTNKYTLFGRPNGGLFWGGQRIVTQYNPHSLYFDHTNGTSKDIGYSAGNNNTKRGAYMTFWNGDDASNAGTFRISARDESKDVQLVGTTSGSLKWNNSAIPTVGSNNTFTGTNNFTGTLQSKGNTVLTTSDASNYFKLNATNTIQNHVLIKDTTTYINLGYEYNSRKGALLSLCSTEHATETSRGSFSLFARNATNSYILQGRASDGALLWKGKLVITQDTPYNLFFDQNTKTNAYLGFNQDSNKTYSGSYIRFNSDTDAASGQLQLSARNLEKSADLILKPDGTLTWSGSGISIGNKPAVTKISSGQATSVWHNHLSSGLLIQSNICSLSANATSNTITLSKPFDNTEYVVFVIFEDDKSNDATGVLSIMNKTTTSFKIHNGNSKGIYRWIAIGHSWNFS